MGAEQGAQGQLPAVVQQKDLRLGIGFGLSVFLHPEVAADTQIAFGGLHQLIADADIEGLVSQRDGVPLLAVGFFHFAEEAVGILDQTGDFVFIIVVDAGEAFGLFTVLGKPGEGGFVGGQNNTGGIGQGALEGKVPVQCGEGVGLCLGFQTEGFCGFLGSPLLLGGLEGNDAAACQQTETQKQGKKSNIFHKRTP